MYAWQIVLRRSVRDRLRAKLLAEPDSIPVLDFTLMRRGTAPNSEHGEEEIDPLFVVEAVYCPDCEMWLNGPLQWQDHQVGKKHRKALQRRRGVVPTDDIEG